MENIGVLLFEDFETLDVFGPVEIFGRLKGIYTITCYSIAGGLVTNSHGVSILTERIGEADGLDIFIIPGGWGTRAGVSNALLIDKIRQVADSSRYVLAVCTGSALLAKTGLLDNRKATSNKRAFDWVCEQGRGVNWQKEARWTVDGKYYTSSGVSAGMDMSFAFLRDRYGIDYARQMALEIEYHWSEENISIL
ncbi:MAG: DJ-1/PfpI family protein [Prevotella sp.]|jgi:putative intracellular protease/amidase|nr:DJ-1/PfpI family protein [Prevotella sp.]